MAHQGQQGNQAGTTTDHDQSRNGHRLGSAVLNSASERTDTNGTKSPQRQEEKSADRILRVKDPNSILLINKTQEGWMLSTMLYPFDKVMQRLRRGAGSRVPFEEAQAVIMKVDGVAQRMKDVLRRLGGADVEYRWREPIGDIRDRERMAARRDAIVIVPRVQDTARLAPLIRGLDESLIRLRMESETFDRCMDELKTVALCIVDLHHIIQQAAHLTDTEYEARGAVAKLLKQHASEA